MFEALFDAAEMRAVEERHPGYPDTAGELMERAGAAVAREAMRLFPAARSFGVVCGAGSNGGDGRIAARVLAEAGHDARETTDPDRFDVVVDALFGTGFRGAPRAEAAALIERINAAAAPVLAVDVPSGVDASTGETPGAAVCADATVTFHGRKVGLVVAPGRFHAGEVIVADIGLHGDTTSARRATSGLLGSVPRRSAADTKYSAGSVLVVGGSPGLTGAACLSAMAALRADAGYVTLAVPTASLPAAETLALEPVKIAFDDAEPILAAAQRAAAVAIGPGLGRERRALVREVLEQLPIPAVVDADGLFGLEPVDRGAPLVLTPHAGELGRLLDETPEWVSAHRLEAARRVAERFGCVCLLKGPDTIVAAPDAGPIVCAEGPPSLATAGTGDVLTGVIAAFLAKGLGAQHAAAAGAVAHGLAARAVPQQAGMVASDLLAGLPRVLSQHA